MIFINMHKLLLLLLIWVNISHANEEILFSPLSPDKLLNTAFGREVVMESLAETIKTDLRDRIGDRIARNQYFNTALHLVWISNRNAEIAAPAVLQKQKNFKFNDQINGNWQIAYEILKTLADYSLENVAKVEIDEKSKYLMAFAVHSYGRTISADLPIREPDESVLKDLRRYYKDQSVAEAADLSVYAWYVYFVACVERKYLDDKDLVRVQSIISEPESQDNINNPRVYQMLCLALIKGDKKLDYDGRKLIFQQKLFKSLMVFGNYQTPEGFYSPYVANEILTGIMDSRRKGYGIDQSPEELRKIWLKKK